VSGDSSRAQSWGSGRQLSLLSPVPPPARPPSAFASFAASAALRENSRRQTDPTAHRVERPSPYFVSGESKADATNDHSALPRRGRKKGMASRNAATPGSPLSLSLVMVQLPDQDSTVRRARRPPAPPSKVRAPIQRTGRDH